MILFLCSNVICVCFYVKSALYVFLFSRTMPMFISPCTLCVIERTLYVFQSFHTLCVFPVFPYPACLAQQMKQLSGITSLLPQCHPGKNNPMILRLMFTTKKRKDPEIKDGKFKIKVQCCFVSK